MSRDFDAELAMRYADGMTDAAETADCAAEDWVDWQIYLAPVEGGRFAVVGWRGDNEAEGPTEIPDAFQPSQAPEPAQ